ncbi:MAG TPA: ABC transporter ATP-binding protein, partial [Edaphobacter sp.]
MEGHCHLCDDTTATRASKRGQAYTANRMPAIGPSSFGAPGMKAADRPSRSTRGSSDLPAQQKPNLNRVLPEMWKLMKPRWLLLCGSFLLMVINRASGLILPASTRYLIDNVMAKHMMGQLPLIIGVVVAATILQGITSFTLTQLLSKEGQRLIAELRIRAQRHIGMLPVAFYDENRTGTLVARIMTDVEGIRNLIGTGIIDFIGGLLTAVFAFGYLIHLSVQMTLTTFAILVVFGLILQRAFRTLRPIFRARSKINSEVTGRLTESLGGVRIIKGYHAEESEAHVFAQGVQRLLDNVISSLTAQSVMSLASTVVLGVVGALVMYLGAHQVVAGRLTTGGYVTYVMFLAFMIAPIVQLVSIGTQLTEAAAGLDRTAELLAEQTEDAEPGR